MVHSPFADILRVDVLALDSRDREDETLNHLAHRVRLVLEGFVSRILPHDDDAACLVIVENLWQVREHYVMFPQSLQAGHLSRRVTFAGRIFLTCQWKFDDEITVQNLTALAESPCPKPSQRESEVFKVLM